jgi:hypothetical protein
MNYKLLDLLTFNRVIFTLLWSLAFFTLLTTVWATVNHYSAVPFWDQWGGTIGFYEKWLTDGVDKIALLFSQHNEHRIALPRLFFLLDCWLSSCDNRISIATIFITQLFTIALLSYAFLKAGGSRKDYLYVVLPFLIIVNYSWIQQGNLTWGFQVQFVGVYFWGALSIMLFSSAKETDLAVKQFVLMSACLLSATFATFSMANGILVMLILILQAFFLRVSIRKHIVLWLFAIFLAVIYFRGYVSPSYHGQPLETIIKQPLELFIYVCAYLGGVFRPGFSSFPKVSILMGACYILLAGFFVFQHLFNKRKLDNLQLSLLAIAGFILLTAIVTGLGRANFGIGQASTSRYTTPAIIGWCSLLLLCWTYGKRGQKVAVIIGIIFLLAVIKVQAKINVNDSRVAFNRDLGLLSVMLGVNDSNKIKRLYPDKNYVLESSKFLELNDLSLYRDGYSSLLNKSLLDTYKGGLRESCSGFFDTIKTDPNLKQGAHVVGWSWFSEEQRPAEYIVIADSEKNIVGVALSGGYRPDVSSASGVRDKRTGWAGYVLDSQQQLIAYAVLGNSICMLKNRPAWPALSLIPVDVSLGFGRVSVPYKIDGDWTINGIYDNKKIQKSDGDILGSWNGSDLHKGEVRFGPIDVKTLEKIAWPLITGPVNTNQKIVVKNEQSGQVIGELQIPLLKNQWSNFRIKLTFAASKQSEKVSIFFVDSGSDWGEWSGVGQPLNQLSDTKAKNSGN